MGSQESDTIERALEDTILDVITVDTWQQAFSKTHRMYNTKFEPSC